MAGGGAGQAGEARAASGEAGLARNRRFACLALARFISVLGNGFGRVAIAFAVLGLPHAAPWQLSVVMTAQAAPQLALVLLGGVVADRVGRARLMVTAEAAAGLVWAGLAVAAARAAPLWMFAALALAAGTATALFLPAMTGVVPELVNAGQLRQANASLRVGQNLAMVLGLGLSGAVVAAVGPAWALAADAASFCLSGALLAVVWRGRRPEPGAVDGPAGARTGLGAAGGEGRRLTGPVLADLRVGAREFFSRQWLWVVAAQYAFVVAAVNACAGVLGPLVADRRLGGAAAWSLLAGSQALGTLTGAALAARLRVARPIRAAVLATFPAALPMLLLAAGAPLLACAAAMFAAGVASDVFGVLWATTLHREVPLAVLSRVSSFDLFASLALAPLGLAVAGPAAAALTPEGALAGCAGMVAFSTAAALLSPEVRRLRGGDLRERSVEMAGLGA